LLTGELEIKNKQIIKGSGITKSFDYVRFSADARKFCESETSKMAVGPTQLPVWWVMEALSAMVKRVGRESDYLPPINIEVTNGLSPLHVSMACCGAILFMFVVL
jgi:hypothetical protein